MDNNVSDPKQALVDKLKESTNILVTVSTNPTVDQLSACLGLTLWLNKVDKHATAVFSGEVPNTIEFLQPESTLEKNTDSLRDFIISLDKSKADKLRYKVEDKVVKIFITPYRTSLSDADLEFSQGDFNVDMVVALGVHAQQDLDAAITAHGRILHDATVATITTGEQASELGSISWHETSASSLSELVVDLGNEVNKEQLDGQIATALLTGIVAETARFSNEKTTPQTMSISAQLMSAGANQQLVASKLEEPEPPKPESKPEAEEKPADKSNDGTLEIDHPVEEKPVSTDTEEPKADFTLPPVDAAEPTETTDEPAVTDVKTTSSELNAVDQPALADDNASRFVSEPPAMGGTLTANVEPEDEMLEPSSDPLSQPAPEAAEQPLLDRGNAPADSPAADAPQPAPPSWMPPQPWMNQPAGQNPASDSEPSTSHDDQTLADIEREVDSPHLKQNATESTTPPDLESARDEVMKAIDSTPSPNPEPIQALNAQPIELEPPQPPAEQPLPPNDASASAAPQEPQPYVPSTAFDPSAFQIANDPDPEVSAATQNANPEPAPEVNGPVDQPFTLPVPGALTPPPANPIPPTSTSDQPAPPPVPPPMTRF